MKIYCSCCDKVQPVRFDDCLDAKTNDPFQDIVCTECDLVIASGTDISQPAIEELEHENRLMRAHNERLQADVERLEQNEKRQYNADHVVLEKGTNDCVCMHCGQRYHIHMPVPMSIMTAIVDAFLEAHHQCEKREAA
jgi:sugar/nucleoside kinase (ribokinase family)